MSTTLVSEVSALKENLTAAVLGAVREECEAAVEAVTAACRARLAADLRAVLRPAVAEAARLLGEPQAKVRQRLAGLPARSADSGRQLVQLTLDDLDAEGLAAEAAALAAIPPAEEPEAGRGKKRGQKAEA